jgi:hypothetical protein
MQRLHTWDKDDTILTLYYVKHDLKGLPVKDEKDLAEGVIGSTKASLQMQAANIRYVLGYDEGILDCFSEIQKAVVDEYNTISFEELKEMAVNIIFKRDVNGNLTKVRAAQKLKEEVKKKKERELQKQKADDDMWRRMGKDPSKMKKVV